MKHALVLPAALAIALLCACAQHENPLDKAVEGTKDALNLRDHEKLKDATEDVQAAAKDAAAAAETAAQEAAAGVKNAAGDVKDTARDAAQQAKSAVGAK